MSSIDDIFSRIWQGRHQLRKVGILGSDLRDVEIVMSVDIHMNIMANQESPRFASAVVFDPEASAGIRIFGLRVRRDPTLYPDEIRFRSEVSL